VVEAPHEWSRVEEVDCRDAQSIRGHTSV
jgi:hypothetical protein